MWNQTEVMYLVTQLPVLAGFSDRVLDLLPALGSHIFAEATPMENREPTPEVTFEPVLGMRHRSRASNSRRTPAGLPMALS
jgi:hypothetical protein